MSHSSGVEQRWDIPKECPYCRVLAGPQLETVEEKGARAKLKCKECARVWRIEPTPVWKVADRNIKAAQALPALKAALRLALHEAQFASDIMEAVKAGDSVAPLWELTSNMAELRDTFAEALEIADAEGVE